MNIEVYNIIGDMDFGIDNSDVYEHLTEEMVDKAENVIASSEIVAVDGTLSEAVLKHVVKTVKAPLFLDPHSEEDAKKVGALIGSFDTIKPNRAEASAICGMDIFSEEQLMAAGQWFADQGVKRIFITLSGGGVYYKEGMTEGILRPEQFLSPANETGAGDAFSAAILDGTVKGMDIRQLAEYGMKAAGIAMECRCAVNPAMSSKRMEEK